MIHRPSFLLLNESSDWVISAEWLKYGCRWLLLFWHVYLSGFITCCFVCVFLLLLCFQLLGFFLVCLSCWWERWTAAPCCLCCPLRRAGWADMFFFFSRETDLPHKNKKKNSENDTVCPTHAFMVVAVKERPVPFPIFTQSVASLASSTVTS